METTESKPIQKPQVIPPSVPEPVVLSFADMQVLGRALRRNLATKEQLMQAVQNTTRVSIAGVSVRLEPRLLERLKSRCFDKANWEKWFAEVVTAQLHDYAGY